MISESKQDLLSALKGNYPLIYIVSEDERPVIETVNQFISDSGEEFDFHSWDSNRKAKDEVTGKGQVINKKVDGKKTSKAIDYEKSLELLSKADKNKVQIFFDFHEKLAKGDSNKRSKLIRQIKDFTNEVIFPFTEDYHLPTYKHNDEHVRRFLLIVSPVLEIPKELESLVHIIHYENPNRSEMKLLLDSFIEKEKIEVDNTTREKIAESSIGLTETEAMLALRNSYFNNNKQSISVKDIQKEKIQIIRKKGSLDYLDTNIDRGSIGGFENLFTWIEKRKLLFNEENRVKHNLPYPNGVMLTGVQGCGKSLAANIIANEFEIPLLRLDMGSLFGKYVGESDKNLKQALKIAEMMSPCVLWIDELEKSFSVNGGSHETTKRMLGYFLTWLQENKHPVFIVATANNIDEIPPEFLRKGRFDEIWFVDLPNIHERMSIFNVHASKRNIHFSQDELVAMAQNTEGYSGAEIEAIIKESTLVSLFANQDDITLENVLDEINKLTPLSIINREKLKAIRKWAAENQVRPVSNASNNVESKIGF